MNQVFSKLQLSKYRCTYIKLKNKSTCFKLIKLINQAMNKNLNFNSSKDLMSLDVQDLEILNDKVKKTFQRKIVEILKKDINFLCKKIFGHYDKNFRVGIQLKHTWKKMDIKKKR